MTQSKETIVGKTAQLRQHSPEKSEEKKNAEKKNTLKKRRFPRPIL